MVGAFGVETNKSGEACAHFPTTSIFKKAASAIELPLAAPGGSMFSMAIVARRNARTVYSVHLAFGQSCQASNLETWGAEANGGLHTVNTQSRAVLVTT
jgi:hypothetical protein